MYHPVVTLRGDVDTRDAQPGGVRLAVIAQRVELGGGDEGRRQAGEVVGAKGAGVGVLAEVLRTEVVRPEPLHSPEPPVPGAPIRLGSQGQKGPSPHYLRTSGLAP